MRVSERRKKGEKKREKKKKKKMASEQTVKAYQDNCNQLAILTLYMNISDLMYKLCVSVCFKFVSSVRLLEQHQSRFCDQKLVFVGVYILYLISAWGCVKSQGMRLSIDLQRIMQ